MLSIHYIVLVGVNNFAEFRENLLVTVWEMLINLLKSPIQQWCGKRKSDPYPGPDHHQLKLISSSYSVPFPPVPENSCPAGARPAPTKLSPVPIPLPWTHFLIPANSRFVMYAMYHSLYETDARPSSPSGCSGAENMGSTWWSLYYTRDSLLSAITSCCQQPHRQTTHCDVTVAAPTDNLTTLLIDTCRGGEGAFTAIQCTDILALMPKCDEWWVMDTQRHQRAVNVDASMSAGLPMDSYIIAPIGVHELPWDFIPLQRDGLPQLTLPFLLLPPDFKKFGSRSRSTRHRVELSCVAINGP